MNKYILTAMALLALSAVAGARAAPVPDRAPAIIPPSTASDAAPSAQHDWVEAIAGKTLTAVDGSTLTLKLTEDGLVRHMVAPDGSEQDTGFTFINRNLGTVSDAKTVVGFFRRNGDGFDITYEDGRSETVSVTPDGGVSMMLRTTDAGTHCMGWYPQGHTFNDAEKHAALALYAKRLGLASQDVGNTVPVDSCGPASSATMQPIPDQPQPVKASLAPKALVATPTANKRHKKRTAELDQPVPPPGTAAPLATVSVRTSEVHPVPDMTMSDTADAGLQNASLQNASLSFDPVHNASACLTVDSDGNHWGFRNRCRFDVEFSYCLKDASTDIASCDKGPESGLVAANGFTPLLRSNILGGNDAERHFRWVGCGLVDVPLEAHLDQTNPPAGRCLAPSAS